VEVSISSVRNNRSNDARVVDILLRLRDEVGEVAERNADVRRPAPRPRLILECGPESDLSRLPNLLRFSVVFRKDEIRPFVRLSDSLGALDVVLNLFLRSAELEEEPVSRGKSILGSRLARSRVTIPNQRGR